MTDSYDDPFYIETDKDGVEYACFIDFINNNDPLFDDDLIECAELVIEDDFDDLDFDE
jgi:hypothetical protein